MKLLLLATFLTNAFWVLGVVVDFNYSPFKQIKKWGIEAGESIRFKLQGEDGYVKEKIEEQLATYSGIRKGRKLKTASLTLNRAYFSLEDYHFAKAKGALEVVENKLLVMDRLGKLFAYDGKKLSEISIDLPNNIKEYILSCRAEKGQFQDNGRPKILNEDNFLAHNLVYDSKRSRIIVSFQKYNKSAKTSTLTIAALPLDIETLIAAKDWTIIVENLRADGLGGGAMVIKEDTLFYSNGYVVKDKGFSSVEEDTEYGKIFKIDLNTNQSEVISRGHRNASGMYLTPRNQLIVTEHGPQGGDEINFIEKGKNYGWPLKTYGTRYGTYDYLIQNERKHLLSNYKEPFFTFVPSIGISSVLQVNNFHPEWEGDFLVGSLKAQTLYRIKLGFSGVIFCEPIWIGHRIRNIVQLEEKLIILTDDANLITLTVET